MFDEDSVPLQSALSLVVHVFAKHGAWHETHPPKALIRLKRVACIRLCKLASVAQTYELDEVQRSDSTPIWGDSNGVACAFVASSDTVADVTLHVGQDRFWWTGMIEGTRTVVQTYAIELATLKQARS